MNLVLCRMALIVGFCLLTVQATPAAALSDPAPIQSPAVTQVPDSGWRLLLDPQAAWQNDVLYLPEQVNLASLPVNPPTAGWEALSGTAGIPVTLPATVEQYYWGKAPGSLFQSARPADIIDFDGGYHGVSWWYRPFTPPRLAQGERLILSLPGARLRAEVYVNRKLVGYNIITEAPFQADLTAALKPGQPNQLAIRITNPGGEKGWADYYTMAWGKYKVPVSRDFGGLASGLSLRVCSPVSVQDLAVYNRPALKSVTLDAQVVSRGGAYHGPVRFAVAPDTGGPAVWRGQTIVDVPAGGSADVRITATVPGARLWDIGKPHLYRATAAVPSQAHSALSTPFGFRWFAPTGLGTDAMLRLNGKRIVVKSSISWGFWAPNGLFPDTAAVAREIADVKALGLNCIQNHRHMPKAIVLDGYDRAGLLRDCEPGAGMFSFLDTNADGPHLTGPTDTSGTGGETADFTMNYELDKLLAMVRSFRSHPAVPLWCVQNEIRPDLRSPRVFYVLRQIHAADPSRLLVLKSGVGTDNEAWMLPYSNDVLYDHGDGVSGWRDRHTAASSPGVYVDSFYNSPTDHVYQQINAPEVSMWGEMGTSASTDNYARDLQWYAVHHQTHSYSLDADKVLNTSYGAFLASHGFRSAFPTTSSLFDQIGTKHYEMDAKMLENGRISDGNDYLVLSGWESTTVDDHSGMVDSLRLLKADPAILRQAAAPALLVVRPHHYVVATGGSAVVDVHLVNEINLKGPYTLEVSATSGGASVFDAKYPVTARGGDVYGELLKDGITITPKQSGYVVVKAALTAPGATRPVLIKTEPFLMVDTRPRALHSVVATIGSGSLQAQDALQKKFGVTAFSLSVSSPRCDVIVADYADTIGGFNWTSYAVTDPIGGTTDPGLYQEQRFGGAGQTAHFRNLPNGPAQVALLFAETYFDAPGKRLFDVALNGKTVLKRFDIYAAASGKDKALIKTFTVPIKDGMLTLGIPAVEADNAQIAGIRITTADGHVIRQVFHKSPYTDASGSRWQPLALPEFVADPALEEALRRVHDDGSRLVFLTGALDGSDSAGIAATLASHHLCSFAGMTGKNGASWLGFWYFARRHWLLSGLPADCVLDWQYQIQNGNGLDLSGPNLDTVIGYGHGHDPALGAGGVVIPDGNGSIVLFSLPGLANAFLSDDAGSMDPVTATRLVYNTLAGPGVPLSFPVLPKKFAGH